jgi:hypothetical protein
MVTAGEMRPQVWPLRHCRWVARQELLRASGVGSSQQNRPTWRRIVMGFGRGALLWLLGVPLPIILLLALFWHN